MMAARSNCFVKEASPSRIATNAQRSNFSAKAKLAPDPEDLASSSPASFSDVGSNLETRRCDFVEEMKERS